MERLVRERGDDDAVHPDTELASVATNRSWVSGRSAAMPWRRIAIAWASQGPIQTGRIRPAPTSLSSRTWRPVRMWTRTLSTTISISGTRSSAMAPIIPRAAGGRRRGADGPRGRPCGGGGGGPGSGVGPARPRGRAPGRRVTARRSAQDAMAMPATNPPMWAQNAIPASGLGGQPQRREAVDQLEHEPEAQDEHRGHRDQLVEEAQEHQRLDPGPREQDQVRAEHRGDRPGCADHRDVARGLHERRARPRPRPRRRGRGRGTGGGRAGPRRSRRRSTGRAGCPSGGASRRAGTCG